MAPRLVRYFAYSGGIAAIFALLYYSYYFSVQVPGEFLFEGGREVFSNWSSPKLTPFLLFFYTNRKALYKKRKTTFIQMIRKKYIYIYILSTHIKQVELNDRKVSHVRDGRQKWPDRSVAGPCRHGPGMSGSLGYTGWRIVIASFCSPLTTVRYHPYAIQWGRAGIHTVWHTNDNILMFFFFVFFFFL